MRNKQFGLIGMLIPFLFLAGMIIYYTLFNIKSIFRINQDPFMVYCIPELPGSGWMVNFNHLFVGGLMILFMIFMIKKTNNSFSNAVGKWLLLASSLSWLVIGLVSYFYDIKHNESAEILVILYLMLWGCGSIGYITLSSEFEKISKNRLSKKLILYCGILIIVEAITNFILDLYFGKEYQYPNIISKIIWLIYFSGFGVIGYTMITKTEVVENQ